MELYLDPLATTSRAVAALCEHERLPVTLRPVSLMNGEHHRPPLADLNPNRLVPVLVDGDFVLTESSAILRYLARSAGSPLYPSAPRPQARVDELIAWFESNFYRDFGYQYVYPQLLPHHRRGDGAANDETIDWGRTQSQRWLAVLDTHFLRDRGPFLLGETLTIADFFGASIVSLGDLLRCCLDDYPRVVRWRRQVDGLDGWRAANREFRSFAESLAGRPFVPLQGAAHARAA